MGHTSGVSLAQDPKCFKTAHADECPRSLSAPQRYAQSAPDTSQPHSEYPWKVTSHVAAVHISCLVRLKETSCNEVADQLTRPTGDEATN